MNGECSHTQGLVFKVNEILSSTCIKLTVSLYFKILFLIVLVNLQVITGLLSLF